MQAHLFPVRTQEEVDAAKEAAPNRKCGECSLCCKVLRVNSLDKPTGTWCQHARPGCAIYEDRPVECRAFSCLWLLGLFKDGDRPDKVGGVFWYADGKLEDEKLGGSIPIVNVNEPHDGACMANERGRQMILELLKKGYFVQTASGAPITKVWALGKNYQPVLLVELPFVDGREVAKHTVTLTIRKSDGVITGAELIPCAE